jgi:hypothetical protein
MALVRRIFKLARRARVRDYVWFAAVRYAPLVKARKARAAAQTFTGS